LTSSACVRPCQKNAWRSHKKYCGKEKIAKKLPGTIHDPFWAYPTLSNAVYVARTAKARGDDLPVTGLGFGTPHPSCPHSPALQRQVALLEGNRDVDYFLFDQTDRPVHIVINEKPIKACFRMLRSEAMFAAKQSGVEAMVEHLIKATAGGPEFSRATILEQFEREYGGDMAAKMAAFEAKGVENGHEPGRTFVETLSASLTAMVAGV
jgi:hypothetical protein